MRLYSQYGCSKPATLLVKRERAFPENAWYCFEHADRVVKFSGGVIVQPTPEELAKVAFEPTA